MNETSAAQQADDAADTAAQEPQASIPIRNARTLFGMLRAPDPATRIAALKAVQAQPEVSLLFGVSEGRDVIDVLIDGSKSVAAPVEWIEWLAVLDRFHDQRVTNFFFDLLANEDETIVLFLAARHLEHVSTSSIADRIEQLVLNSENPMRARAASSVLKNAPRMSERARIRLGLLCGNEVPIPPLDTGNAAAWLAELNGGFTAEAMAALQAQGEQTWVRLALLWNDLHAPMQVWLLRWGCQDFPAMVTALLPQALGHRVQSVVLEALRVIADLGGFLVPASIHNLAAAFLCDPNPDIREAAVNAGPPQVNWRMLLTSESNPAVRVALLRQLATTEGEQAIPQLIQTMRTGHWQERCAAAECLTQIGSVVIEPVKGLMHDADEKVRIGAVRILLSLRQDAWLEDELLRAQ